MSQRSGSGTRILLSGGAWISAGSAAGGEFNRRESSLYTGEAAASVPGLGVSVVAVDVAGVLGDVTGDSLSSMVSTSFGLNAIAGCIIGVKPPASALMSY